MADSQWTAADIPDQSGRVAIVTGANSGLGLATAERHGPQPLALEPGHVERVADDRRARR